MNIAAKVTVDQPVGVSVANNRQGLERFCDPACSALVWQRDVPPEVTQWFDALDPNRFPVGRVVVPIGAVADTVLHMCDVAGLPEGSCRDWFTKDIVGLSQVFAAIMKTANLRLRLQAVTTNACRKFHVDAITGRLVCTYRGTGTQYGTSAAGLDPDLIFTTSTGAPILLRGSLWPSKPASGLLHRSPPIEGTGETRFVLVLDPVFNPEDDA